MKHFYLISMMLTAFSLTSRAQLEVGESGNVAIAADSTNYNAKFKVGNANINFVDNIGIIAYPQTKESKQNKAIVGRVNTNTNFTNESNFGVQGSVSLNPNHGRNFGITGAISFSSVTSDMGGAGVYALDNSYLLTYPVNIPGIYAAYIHGHTYIVGQTTAQEIYTPADESLSDNVESLETRDGASTLDNLMKMNVLEFNMKSREETEAPKDGEEMSEEMRKSYEALKKDEAEMYARRHFGLSAQELQKIYPNLVLKGQDNYFYVNYTELVPILIRSIQELKAELDEVKGKNSDDSKSRAAGLENEKTTSVIDATSIPATATLAQNTPNPFSERTTIRFTLPDNAQNAFIYIFDMSGKMQKQIPVSHDMQSVTIEGYELRAGMYIYSLVVGGKEIDTKRMILTK